MRECSCSQATLQPQQHWRRVVIGAIVHPNCVGFLFERCQQYFDFRSAIYPEATMPLLQVGTLQIVSVTTSIIGPGD
jgi:hypothetical protein